MFGDLGRKFEFEWTVSEFFKNCGQNFLNKEIMLIRGIFTYLKKFHKILAFPCLDYTLYWL